MSSNNGYKLGVAFLVCALPLFGASITIAPSTSSSLVPGQSFSINVNVSGVTDLYADQFDVGFDPAILEATSVTEGPFLKSGGTTIFIPGTIDNTAGVISFSGDTLVGPIPGVTGAGVLETVQFKALADGTSGINLANVILLDSSQSKIAASTAGITVAVGIPEPGTWGVVALGIVLLLPSWFIARHSGTR